MDYKNFIQVAWVLFVCSSRRTDFMDCKYKMIDNNSTAIDCSENNDTDTIPDITNIKEQVISLDMSGCIRLISIKQGAFLKYIHLRTLDLSRTSLKNVTEDSFKGLGKLVLLDISQNERFPVTNDIFITELLAPLTSLKELRIYGTTGTYNTEDFPENFLLKLTHLTSLEADARTGISFGPVFLEMENLTDLYISGDKIIPPWRSPEFCKLVNITSTTFQNLIYVQKLSIRKCGIVKVSADAFKNMINLEVLDLSFNNDLTVKEAFLFFPDLSTNVKTVILEQIEDVLHMPCNVDITTQMMSNLKNTNVTSLYLTDNRIAFVEHSAFKEMPQSLKHVYLSRNKLQAGRYMLYAFTAQNLKTLDISFNGFPGGIWQRANKNKNDYSDTGLKQQKRQMNECPYDKENIIYQARKGTKEINLKDVVAFKTVCRSESNFGIPFWAITFYLPLELEVVNISYSKMSLPIIELHFEKNNSIRTIKARKCMFYCWQGPIFGLERLENIDLSWNDCMFVNYTFFSPFAKLRRLDISVNFLFQTIENTREGILFKNNTELRFLDLTLNHIKSIPYDFFKHQHQLEILNISDNHLRELNFTIIHMKQLKLLDLSHNHIRSIHSNMLGEFKRIHQSNRTVPLKLDLRENDLECSCDNMGFFRLVLRNSSSQSLSIDINRCLNHNLQGKSLCLKCRKDLEALVLSLEKRCENYSAIIIFSSLLIGLFINVIVVAIVHRNRWKICYWFYVVNTQRGESFGSIRRFRYDVFFAYAEEKQAFVDKYIRGRLMSLRPGCRMFLQHADSVPGQNVIPYFGNIIHASRVVVFFISKDCWKQSPDWTTALHMSHEESLHRNKAMFIGVLLGDDVSEDILPDTVVEISHRRRLLRYPCNENNVELVKRFWDKFTKAIDNFKHQTTQNL